MTIDDFLKLKTGDIIFDGVNIRFVKYFPETHHSWPWWTFYINSPDEPFAITIHNKNRVLCLYDVNNMIKDWYIITPEIKLELDIKNKEIELENLKKELDELKRKNRLARIIPGNVYRFKYDGETYVRCVREICDNKIFTKNLTNGYQDSFYIDGFEPVELLPELTEAYKNFKTLLEKSLTKSLD